MLGFKNMAFLVLWLSLPSAVLAQTNSTGSSSQTPGLVPQLINPDEPTYCRADGAALCAKDQAPSGAPA